MADRLSYRAHAVAVLSLGLPLVGSHLAQMALHVTDTIMLGWYSVEALAAVVLGGTLFFNLFILGSGFAQAVMPMVAHAVASGSDAEVRRSARMGLWLSFGYGIAVMPVMWWSEALLLAIGQKPEVALLAQDFLRIAGAGMVPALVVMLMKSYLSAMNRTQVVLWVTLGGVGLNVLVGWTLIFGHLGAPELGIRGAAIASVVVQFATALALLAYASLFGPIRRYGLFQRFWRPDPVALRQVWRLGWPIGLTGLAESGLFTAASVMMGWIGTHDLAAHGIANQVAAITFMVHLGLSNAATVRAGQSLGRRDAVELADGARVAIAMSAMVGIIAVMVMLSVPHLLIGLFLSDTDPQRAELIRIGSALLAMAALFQFADAAQVMALGLLRGVQDTRVPLLIAAVSYWVIGIPASYALGFGLGLGGVGIWLGLVVGLACAASLLMLRFWTGKGRLAPVPVAAG